MALLEDGELGFKLKPDRLARPVTPLFVGERFFLADGCTSSEEAHRVAFGFSPPDDPDFATRLRNGLGAWANGGTQPRWTTESRLLIEGTLKMKFKLSTPQLSAACNLKTAGSAKNRIPLTA